MSKKQTQREWVLEQMEKYGEVSRNNALSNFISRLGAIMCDLKAEGYEFTTIQRGGDYVYRKTNSTQNPIIVAKPEGYTVMDKPQRFYIDPLTNEKIYV